MRKARLLDNPVTGILETSFGNIEGIVIAEDSDSSYIIITDESKLDEMELIGLKSNHVSGIKDFWTFYLPTFLLGRIFTPDTSKTLTQSDLDKYKSTEVNELYDAYLEQVTVFENDLNESLSAKYNTTDDTELSEADKEEFREMIIGLGYGYQEFKSKKDVAEILIHNLRSDVLKSYIFGGSEDVVYKYIKNNRSKGTPSEIISKGFDIVKKALGEKFNFEFV